MAERLSQQRNAPCLHAQWCSRN